MANWLLKASEKWLRPVYDVLHEQLCREPVLHADGYQGYLYFDVLPWLNLFLRFCDDWR